MAGHGAPEQAAVDAAGMSVGIVATRWHAELVDQMLDRAQAAAKACGVTDVTVARVSGSVELPVIAQALARKHDAVVAQALAKEHDAVVALGVVIRGETAHFEYVSQSVTDGLTRVALDEATPVAHGVLTVDTEAQARDRAGLPESNEDKGWDAVVAALDAAITLRDLAAR